MLSGNGLTGSLPAELGNLSELESLDVSANRFSSLPDLTGLTNLDSLAIDNLTLTFKDIIPNLGVASSTTYYAPQLPIGDTTWVEVAAGDSISFGVEGIDYTGNQYQWEKDGVVLDGETDTTLTISQYRKKPTLELCS